MRTGVIRSKGSAIPLFRALNFFLCIYFIFSLQTGCLAALCCGVDMSFPELAPCFKNPKETPLSNCQLHLKLKRNHEVRNLIAKVTVALF